MSVYEMYSAVNADNETYLGIEVRYPITHITWDQGQYTSYEICLQTNDMAFTSRSSKVRRRYSEFIWLRKKLRSHHRNRKPPELPPKRLCSSRFDKDFIERRRRLLEEWLNKVVKVMIYVSDSTLHLFLQTPLPDHDMDECIRGKSKMSATEYVISHAGPIVHEADSDDSDAGSWVDLESNDTLFALPSSDATANLGIGPSIVNTIVDTSGSATFISHTLVGRRTYMTRVMSAPSDLANQGSSPRSILRPDAGSPDAIFNSSEASIPSRERRVKFSPTVMVNTIHSQNYA
ncbi:PREDICTED: sorting nexin-10-like [Priapulus caudatus]|uniref:Sorting nexin-10-like n=1 Tax=Priapulus caudatus TaxID=37621 RepID=A0ABM1E8R3_PRICU|nr:PREDICTED: sorting nexin-10-like [Priapulus caudatus]